MLFHLVELAAVKSSDIKVGEESALVGCKILEQELAFKSRAISLILVHRASLVRVMVLLHRDLGLATKNER